MPICSGIATFEGPATQLGATWAEKSSPMGPDWLPSGKSEGSGQSSLAGRCGLAVNVMEPTGNQLDLSHVGGQSLSKRQDI